MLYANGKPLDEASQELKDEYNEVVNRLWQTSLSDDQFIVRFKIRHSDISYLKNTQGQFVTTSGEQHIPFSQSVHDKKLNRLVNWVYSETPLPENNGRVDVSQAKIGRWFFRQDRITETITDEELAFFLYHVDPRFGEKNQNSKYQLIDTRGENQRRIEQKTPQIEFEYTLYGPQSSLADDEKLQMVAQAWGIEQAGKRDRADLIVHLESAVLKGEQEKLRGNRYARGIKEFLEDVKMGEQTQIRSIAQMAVDHKILAVDKRPDRMGIYWTDTYGNQTDKILTLTQRTKEFWLDNLTEYLNNYPNVLDILKADLNWTKDFAENAPAEIGNMAIQEFFDRFYEDDMKSKVREVAMKCGLKPVGKKKPAIRQELLDYFNKHYGFEYKEENQKTEV